MHLMTTKILLAVAPKTLGLHIAPRLSALIATLS